MSIENIVVTISSTFAVGIVLFIVLMVFRGAQQAKQQAKESQTWPRVLGSIVESQVEARQSTSTNQHGTTTSIHYHPRVVYEYEVGGHRYQANRINFSEMGYGSTAEAQKVTNRYLAGNSITVYYNPSDPGQAVLEREAGEGARLQLKAGLFILTILLCIGLSSLAALIATGTIP